MTFTYIAYPIRECSLLLSWSIRNTVSVHWKLLLIVLPQFTKPVWLTYWLAGLDLTKKRPMLLQQRQSSWIQKINRSALQWYFPFFHQLKFKIFSVIPAVAPNAIIILTKSNSVRKKFFKLCCFGSPSNVLFVFYLLYVLLWVPSKKVWNKGWWVRL